MAIVSIKPVDKDKDMYITFYVSDESIKKGDFYFRSGMNADISIGADDKDTKDTKVSDVSIWKERE